MTKPITDPYAALGIPSDATDAQIHEAYRRLAKHYHPDLHREAHAGERMRTINQAWMTLSSPAARARYDSGRSAARSRSASNAWSPTTDPGVVRTTTPARRNDGLGPGSLVLALVAVWLLFMALFVGFLPPFLFGLVVLLSARGILGRA